MAFRKNHKRPTVLTLRGAERSREMVLRCAGAVAGDLDATLRHICYGEASRHAHGPDRPRLAADSENALEESFRALSARCDLKMIVADWPLQSRWLYCVLELLRRHNAPAIMVRKGRNEPPVRNALVLASGGPHIIQYFWAAREISLELGLAPRLLCVEFGPAPDGKAETPRSCTPGVSAARLVGMKAPLHICRTQNLLEGILRSIRTEDLVIIGGPNYARLGEYFRDSIPDVISATVPNDIVMILGHKPPVLDLRHIFWEDMVCMDMEPKDRNEAIAMLIDRLIKNNQLPAQWRRTMLEKALKREEILPTVTDAGAAFPHVTIPGISGIVGALGLCPKGVDFGSDAQRPARFLFLLVTPQQHYEDYLGVLSDIAAIMISPERRSDILRSQSPTEILRKLEAYQKKIRPKPPYIPST